MDILGHITTKAAWKSAQKFGEYRAPSLEEEGFIHCSRPDQLLAVANNFYREQKDLVVLWIAPNQVDVEIRWEDVEGVQFPHIYGAVNLDAVVMVSDLLSDKEVFFRDVPNI